MKTSDLLLTVLNGSQIEYHFPDIPLQELTKVVRLAVIVPESHAASVRQAMGRAGAGKLGRYSHCTFSIKGIVRFIPEEGAHPYTGHIGQLEEIVEERIETICPKGKLEQVIAAIKEAHPYEEVPIYIHQMTLR